MTASSQRLDSVSTLLLEGTCSYIGDPDVISRRKKEDSKRKEEGANSFTDFSEEILTNPSANLKVKCLFFVCLCIFFFTQHFSV